MRLFIAINFNDVTRSRLLALRDELRHNSERGNFTAPENMHLTLIFLGECDGRQASTVKRVMDELVFEPFNVRIDSVGRFRRAGGDIWWAGVHEKAALANLYNTMSDALSSVGFTVERRAYSPHITLGREVITDYLPRQVEPFGETINSIDLMKSERIRGNLVYTPIHKRECRG